MGLGFWTGRGKYGPRRSYTVFTVVGERISFISAHQAETREFNLKDAYFNLVVSIKK